MSAESYQLFINTDIMVPAEEDQLQHNTGWQKSTICGTGVVPNDDIDGCLSDKLGDMLTYFNNQYIVTSVVEEEYQLITIFDIEERAVFFITTVESNAASIINHLTGNAVN